MDKVIQTPEYVDFFEELPTEEVVAPTTEATVPEVPIISEDAPTDKVETPETPTELNVPKSRFDEVYAKSKESERQLEELRSRVETLTSQNAPKEQEPDGPELEPEAQAAIRNLLKKEGLMTRAEFDEANKAEKASVQLQSDVRDLSDWTSKEGYPKFEPEAIIDWAKDNDFTISSKASLKAAYLAQNQEAITDAAVKRALSAAGSPKATTEKPGAGTGKAPSAPTEGPKTVQSRIGDVLTSMGISG